jgi:hypothetical protein
MKYIVLLDAVIYVTEEIEIQGKLKLFYFCPRFRQKLTDFNRFDDR